MKYRADVDGLRAVAIILVLAYHGGLSIFPSGFIGVDVFFVISGFLITSIIHHSLNNHEFSFIAFYKRRLWRLQPVFICLLLLTSLTALMLFLPDDLLLFTRSARKTSLFTSNIFFMNNTGGYFSPDVNQLPLLHTWSLSIEWQCYLILPLMIFGLHHYLKPQYFKVSIFLLTALGVLFSSYNSNALPAETYYRFTSRIFEFLVGASISLLPCPRFIVKSYVINFLGIAALIGIFYVAHRQQILIAYPNGYALLVCMATALLIFIGSTYPFSMSVKILSKAPLVFIGVLSYSIYIWHWAIFAFLKYQNINFTNSILFLAYSVTIGMAYLSWKYLEKPSKRWTQFSLGYTIICLLVLPIALTHLNSFVIKTYMGFPQRYNKDLLMVYKTLDQFNSVQRSLCINTNSTNLKQNCFIGAVDNDPNTKKALLIGDSFSNHYWGFFDTLGKAAQISIFAQGTSSCLTLPGVMLYDWGKIRNKIFQECFDNTTQYFKMIEEGHYDYVIIGQFWSNYMASNIINSVGDSRSLELAKQRIEIAVDRALNSISVSGAKPVLIASTASTNNNLRDCFFKHFKFHQAYDERQCNFSLQVTENDQWLNTVFTKMQRKYPQLIVIDPKKVQCPDNICKADLKGVPVYRDEGHITDYASYQLGAMYLEKFGNPLA